MLQFEMQIALLLQCGLVFELWLFVLCVFCLRNVAALGVQKALFVNE